MQAPCIALLQCRRQRRVGDVSRLQQTLAYGELRRKPLDRVPQTGNARARLGLLMGRAAGVEALRRFAPSEQPGPAQDRQGDTRGNQPVPHHRRDAPPYHEIADMVYHDTSTETRGEYSRSAGCDNSGEERDLV